MIQQAEIKGLYVPLFTPMKRNGDGKCRIALTPKFYEYIDLLIKYAKGIVPGGTTGQGATLKPSEQIDIAVDVGMYIKNRAQLIVGISSDSTDDAIEKAQGVERKLGATTFLHPIGADVSQKEVYAHFQNLANQIDGNIILYSNKQRNSKIELDTIIALADNPKIVGVKDSSMTTDKIRKILKKHKDFAILSGNDYSIVETIQAGGRGAIAAIAHFAPKITANAVNYALENEFWMARAYQQDINRLVDKTFNGANVAAVIANVLGTDTRSPHESISFTCPDKIKEINKILSKFSPEELGIDLSQYRMH